MTFDNSVNERAANCSIAFGRLEALQKEIQTYKTERMSMEKSIIELRSIIQNDRNCPKINYDRDFDTLKRANLSILRLLESYRDNYTENTER